MTTFADGGGTITALWAIPITIPDRGRQEPQTSRAADVRMDVLRAATAPVSSRNAGSAATGFGAFRNHASVSRL